MSAPTKREGKVGDIAEWLRGLSARRKTAFGPVGLDGCRYDEAADEITHLRADLAEARLLIEDAVLILELKYGKEATPTSWLGKARAFLARTKTGKEPA